jgi:hypothetical protein
MKDLFKGEDAWHPLKEQRETDHEPFKGYATPPERNQAFLTCLLVTPAFRETP